MTFTHLLPFSLLFLAGLPLAAQAPQPAPAGTPFKASAPIEVGPIKVAVEGPVDAQLAPVAGQLVALFYESYPKLIQRFDHPAKPCPRTIRIVFDPALDIPAHYRGGIVTVSCKWLRQHPEDVALLTHELTHAVQSYPGNNLGWVTEGLADYARHLYGPKVQPNWELPKNLYAKQSYRDSYRTTGRFFLWLDGKYPGVTDKVHRRMQEGGFKTEEFAALTGRDIDTLWADCLKDLAPAGR